METKEFSFTYHYILRGVDLKDAQEKLQEKLNRESESRDVLIAEQWGAEEVQHQYPACPKCGGELTTDDNGADAGAVWNEISCAKCGFGFNEVYEFAQNETLDTCVPLDAKGDVTDEELHESRKQGCFLTDL